MDNHKGNCLLSTFTGRKFQPRRENRSFNVDFDTFEACLAYINKRKDCKGYSPEVGWDLGVGRFDKDWNWLMPVIEKISKMPLIGAEDYQDVCYPRTFNMPKEDGQVMFRFNGFQVHAAPTLIQAAFMACVDVVEFLNETEKMKKSNES